MKPGDVVRLNSGGPDMVVISNHDDQRKCAWMDGDAKLHMHCFPYECLTWVRTPLDNGLHLTDAGQELEDKIHSRDLRAHPKVINFDWFIAECCFIAPDAFVPVSEIKAAYEKWRGSASDPSSLPSMSGAMEHLTARFARSRRIVSGTKCVVFQGIRLRRKASV